MEIPIDRILPNPEQPRATFDSEAMAGLISSVKEHGVINPIAVEGPHMGADGEEYYVLVDGERRWRAAKLAGLATIPAGVRPAMNGQGSERRLVMAIVANIQRADMNPIEEAKAYARLQAQGMTKNKIALLVGRSTLNITSRLRLLDLDVEIQEKIASGDLPKDMRVADALMAVPDRAARVKLAARMARPGVSIKAIETACTKMSGILRSEATPAGEKMKLPAVDVGLSRAHRERKELPNWDMMVVQKRVPPWKVVRESALRVCDDCPLREVASEKTCRDCPAAQLVAYMLEGGKTC